MARLWKGAEIILVRDYGRKISVVMDSLEASLSIRGALAYQVALLGFGSAEYFPWRLSVNTRWAISYFVLLLWSRTIPDLATGGRVRVHVN
jgi:hypothetical protein